jgi:hypothetical protein
MKSYSLSSCKLKYFKKLFQRFRVVISRLGCTRWIFSLIPGVGHMLMQFRFLAYFVNPTRTIFLYYSHYGTKGSVRHFSAEINRRSAARLSWCQPPICGLRPDCYYNSSSNIIISTMYAINENPPCMQLIDPTDAAST